ncbi:MAG TPA: SDR family NAD(P)-dependent oxidoreductase, partial [Vicinamibacteria bacterium]|nr:SDR family NAD(P)-dependent oxidoreductase [Vicinamibacteria bacterium]
GEWEQVLSSLGELYVRGVEVDWAGFDRDYPRRKVVLPTYPFQRERYWFAAAGGARRPAAAPGAPEDPADGWLYETVWRTEPLAVSPPLRVVADAVEARLPAVADEHGLARYDALQPEVDALCGLYVKKGLRDLGWAPRPGERIVGEELRARLGILEAHRRLLERLLVILAEDGVLRRVGADWEAVRPLDDEDPAPRARTLLERFPAHHAELTVAARCGERLGEVLQGRYDALQVLFPGGSLDLAEKLYQEAPAARVFNTLVRESVRAAAAGFPMDRPLRVLEIGGGTGATTAHVLPALPADRTEYVFTDVSRLFAARAEQKFRDRPYLRCEVLDIERDPVEQGFAPQAFDVVIAANVLHATADLRRTLRNVRRLLAPAGVLVLLEATGPLRFEDLTVGLTEGWWRFSDLDLRPSYALLSRERWVSLLGEMGFADASAFPGGPEVRGALAQQTVVLAREPRAGAGPAAGRWLILADGGGLGEELAARLEQQGGSCVVRRPGASAGADAGAWRGVVDLRGLDASDEPETTAAALAETQRGLCGGVLDLVQTLMRGEGSARPRLWIVTRGTQPAGPSPAPIAPAPSTLWGLGKVVALEHPELHCTRIDLDPEARGGSVDALVEEILAGSPEDQVAIRGGERRVARLARRTPPPVTLPSFRGDGSFLITGGLGGLGLLVARFMVEHGARHVVLMGRRAPSENALAVIRELEGRGARVVVAQADVSSEEGVRGVLTQIAGSLPPLRGVIHAAGVLDDGVLLQQNWSRFAKVMAPKVEGGWNLHRLTEGAPLDFFVLFSSGAALLGSPGQGNHAAANAFLDALAHHRRSRGLPAVSINWGVWSEVGAAAERGVEDRVAGHGMEAFSPRDGLRILGRLIGDAPPQVGVLAIDWPRLSVLLPALPFYADLARTTPARATSPARETAAPAVDAFCARLAEAPPLRRWTLLEEKVRAEAVKVLGLDAARVVETDRPLQELGLDSLMALELRNALGKAVGEALPATLLFDHPTLERLVAFLGRQVLDLEPPARPPAATGPAPGGLDDLSEGEMAALLASRLDAIDQGQKR